MTTQFADIQISDRDSHLHPFTSVPELLEEGPTVIVRGDGCVLEDAEGNHLYDATAGLWCVNVGHGRQEVIDAIRAQLDKLAFFHSFNGMSNEPIALLSRRILDIAPPNMRRVFFEDLLEGAS